MAQELISAPPRSLQIAGGHTRHRDINVGATERMLSSAGGGALALIGMSRGDLGGLVLAIGGGLLVYRGLTGHCPCYDALDISTADEHGPATSVAAGHGIKVECAVTVSANQRPAATTCRTAARLTSTAAAPLARLAPLAKAALIRPIAPAGYAPTASAGSRHGY